MALVKILIVTDDDGGFQRSTSSAHKFHLGEFVKVLTDTDWEGFSIAITTAHRSNDPAPATPKATHPIGADLYGFRFSSTSLTGYDMAFFLSIAAKSEDPVASDASRQAEAAAIAAFMEAGKGFFATGDHEDLGASICQHIPRVRSMRRWAYPNAGPHGGKVAPSGTGANRHDTLQAGSDQGSYNGNSYPYQFNDQSDAIPQPLWVRSYKLHQSRWFSSSLPHPLLCSPLGRITVLPDHMHEGWCEEPEDVAQDENLPGRAGKKEYPLDPDGQPVTPEVIAKASVLQHETLNQEFGGSFALSPMTTSLGDFGVIAAYDGHRAKIGRVVVDATWHHFVNINLIGTAVAFAGLNPNKTKGFYAGPGDTPVEAYQKIMWYFRNLVYWLIPANRKHLVLSQFANALHRHPRWEEFKTLPLTQSLSLRHLIGFAQLAEEYFNQVRGHCIKYHLLPIILYPIWKFDPRIWEELIPEIDPWHPLAEKLGARIKPLETWRQDLLPNARLRWLCLLGTVAIAVSESIKVHAAVEDQQLESIQKRTLDLLPAHLELLSRELDASIKLTQTLSEDLKQTAQVLQRAATALDTTGSCKP